ncbi:LysR family transcriptional regulator [Mariniluteicoccus endophyticus]
MNPLHLRTLMAVLRTGSFADAARQLGYTGSAVSQQMAALERATRLTLFDREAHSVRATPAAHALADQAREVLADLERLDNDVAAVVEGTVGKLRVGSFPSVSEWMLPQWLSSRRELFPNLALHLDEGEPHEIVPLVEDGELDLGLVYRYDMVPRTWPRSLVTTPLLEDELVVLVAETNPLAAATVVDIGDLADHMWINTSDAADGTQCLGVLAARYRFEPKVDYRSNNYAVIRGLVAADLGIALTPSLGYHAGAGVVAKKMSERLYRHIEVVHRRKGINPAVPTAIRGLQETARGLAETIPGVNAPAAA